MAPEKPRLVGEAMSVRAGALGRSACQRRSASTEPSLEPLSTTTTRAGRGVAASSDTRQAIVSVSPFQFTTTTPRLPTETIRAPFLPHAHDLHLQGGTYFQPHAVELIKAG